MQALFDFPTGILSVLLVIVVVYWLLVLLGALDLELFDLDPDTGSAGPWGSLGLVGVPASIGLSIAIAFAWLVVASTSTWLGGDDGPGLALGAGLLVAGIALGLWAARIAIKPLRPLFRVHGVRRAPSLIGKVVTITTTRVDENFGQARLQEGAEDLVLQVRADAGNRLTRDTRALLIRYDDDEGAFQVMRHDDAKERALLADN